MSEGKTLFEEVVGRSGLASWVGPGTVQRALSSVGVTPASAGPEDYRRALPQLKARMAIYLPAVEIGPRIRKIEALLGPPASGPPASGPPASAPPSLRSG